MDSFLLPMIERLESKGASQFSHWQPTLFREYCQMSLASLCQEMQNCSWPQASARIAATALAEVLCEGIGRGYVSVHLQDRPANLMEYCFRHWLVPRLAAVPPEESLGFLANTWNLLEGLMREPRWVNTYVMARIRELENEADVQAFLVHVLRPLFEPASNATWHGPFQVTMLSMRSGDDEFLPGDMHLVAPTVLSVKDRRRNIWWGVLLRKQGKSELAGHFGETSPYVEQSPTAVPGWHGDLVTLGKERVQLRFLREPFRWLQVCAGFVVASAIDSQKLWIVESAT